MNSVKRKVVFSASLHVLDIKKTLSELWAFRDLLAILVLRDIKVRYKQTLLGFLWVILQPLASAGVFSVIFGYLIGITTSNNTPYPLFAFSGVLLWQFFARILNEGALSLSNNQNLISKVYFPRMILPMTPIFSSLFDLCIGLVLCLLAFLIFSVPLGATLVWLPGIILLTALMGLSISLWFSAFDALYRDIRHSIPFLTQVWFFLTPVVYPLSTIPQKWHGLASLNPMVVLLSLFRWCLLGGEFPVTMSMCLISGSVILFLFLTGFVFFQLIQRNLVDRI